MQRTSSLQACAVLLGVSLGMGLLVGAGSGNAAQNALSSHTLASPACRFGLAETEFRSFATNSPENLLEQLSTLGVSKREARHVLAMLKQRAALKDLREASRLVVARQFDPCESDRMEVISMTLAVENVGDVTVARNDAGSFSLAGAEERYVFHLRVSGKVEDGDLAKSLIQAGLPGTVADQMIDSFTADAELPTYRIRDGAFDVVYQVFASAQGALTEAVLTAAELTVDRRSRRIYYYKPEGAAALVLDDQGRPVGPQPAALVSSDDEPSLSSDAALPQKFIHPLPQGRYTSGFGWRRHPVLGKRKFHNGVDFSAPQGTPVMAVGDGVVALVDKHRTYGKRIVLSHSDGVETVYAHLHGFAASIRPGQIVRQGQIVGYVGRSGLASGNHLYLEVVVDGRFIDPMAHVPALKNHDATYAVAPFEAEDGAPAVSDLDLKRFVAMADALRDHLPARASVFR